MDFVSFLTKQLLSFKNYKKFLKLNDGRLIFFTGGGSDFRTQKINNPPKELTGGTDAQAYLYEWYRYNSMIIKIYDPVTDEILTVGHLAVPRGTYSNFRFDAVVLKDGRVLITGGEKDIEKHKPGDRIIRMAEAEIFDPKIGESKLIKNMNYKRVNNYSVLLDDGRVLLYGGNRNELYIPKSYKLKES